MDARPLAVAALACATLLISCNSPPPFVEYEPSGRASDLLSSTPIVVVAKIISNPDEAGTPRPSKWDSTYLIQVYRLPMQVENVLKGDVSVGDTVVYYLKSLGAMDGPYRLGMSGTGGTWHVGDREMFFLRRDSGALRTVCDTWNTCVETVFSGIHSAFKPNPGEPVAHEIIDLLLTRGQGCSDEQMIEAISKLRLDGLSPNYTIQKLQQLAANETPAVRKQACETLANFRHPGRLR